MVLVIITLLGVATVPLFGGRFRRLTGLRVHQGWTIGAALGAQVVLLAALRSAPAWQTDTIHVATYLVAGGFVWRNRHLKGLAVAALGGLSNFAAISANGGVMPASPSALRAAGKVLDLTEFTNSGPMAHPKLLFLGDVIPFPYPHALANVFSVGDILLVAGIVVVVHQTCGSSLRRRTLRRPTPVAPHVIDAAAAVTPPAMSASIVDEVVDISPTCAEVVVAERPGDRWGPPLPPPPVTIVGPADGTHPAGTGREYPIDLLPLEHPADGRALVDA
jgi:hypothetical protein